MTNGNNGSTVLSTLIKMGIGAAVGAGISYFAFGVTPARCQQETVDRTAAAIQQYNAKLVNGLAGVSDFNCAVEIANGQYGIVCGPKDNSMLVTKSTIGDRTYFSLQPGSLEQIARQPVVASVPLQPQVRVYVPNTK